MTFRNLFLHINKYNAAFNFIMLTSNVTSITDVRISLKYELEFKKL